MRSLPSSLAALLLVAAPAAAQTAGGAPADPHAGHAMPAPAAATVTVSDTTLPAGAAEAEARLAKSPRHAEWAMIATGNGDSTRAWVVYPERREKAPVVVVVHEIFGLSPWVRAVADQLAADGFIAVAPDLLTRFAVPGSPLNPNADTARAVIRQVDPADMNRQVTAVAQWAMKLPAALPKYGIVGFCWGGTASYDHAILSPTGLGAAVVYYGSAARAPQLAQTKVPILGHFGGNDARVNATIPAADSVMKANGKSFEAHVHEGAGHGFLRQQDGQNGANLRAAQAAWPATIAFFRKHLGA